MVDLEPIFRAQHESFAASGAPGPDERLEMLALLKAGVLADADTLAHAVEADFGRRAATETRLTEILTVTQELTHIRRHLRSWMKPLRVPVEWTLWPARAWIRYEPLGVVGVIGAWNYPIVLTLSPLANALAAGNRVMLKLPERTPATNQVIDSLLGRLFPRTRVAVITGGASVGEVFARLPFGHLLFTGSTAVGRQVLTGAAARLTPVTLELGGKSPAIIDHDFPLETAASRIAAGKFLNAGQTCIAPDYVLVPRQSVEPFERHLRAAFARLYPAGIDSPDYTWIIDRDHWERLSRLLEDASRKGARLVPLAPGRPEPVSTGRAFPPTLVYDCHPDMAILQEEIFGPILPVLTYDTLAEAVAHVQAGPAPLALYYFGRNRKRREDVLRMTRSGGVVVNDTLLHFVENGLPFGGVGESGMGAYHGHHGFLTFSKARAVFQQGRFSGFALLRPPYGRRTRRLLDLLIH